MCQGQINITNNLAIQMSTGLGEGVVPSIHVAFFVACQVTSVVSDSWPPYGLWPTRLLCPWDFSGTNTGVGCHALLQGIWQRDRTCISYVFCIERWVLYHLWSPMISLFKNYLFIYVGLSWTFIAACRLWLQRVGATLYCGAQASHCVGFSCQGARMLHRVQTSVIMLSGISNFGAGA